MKHKILQADVPTANGNVYPTQTLQAAIAEFERDELRQVLVTLGVPESPEVDLHKTVGFVDHLEMDENGAVVADINVFAPHKETVDMLLATASHDFVAAGIASNVAMQPDGTKTIEGYTITSVNLVMEPAVKYK